MTCGKSLLVGVFATIVSLASVGVKAQESESGAFRSRLSNKPRALECRLNYENSDGVSLRTCKADEAEMVPAPKSDPVDVSDGPIPAPELVERYALQLGERSGPSAQIETVGERIFVVLSERVSLLNRKSKSRVRSFTTTLKDIQTGQNFSLGKIALDCSILPTIERSTCRD